MVQSRVLTTTAALLSHQRLCRKPGATRL